MKYELDRNASAELMRLVLQRMSRYTAAFTPFCYAVWYEYLAGINPSLRQEMDGLLAKGGIVDDDVIQKLYEDYVSECNTDAERVIGNDAQRILEDIKNFASDADYRASEYGNHLERSAGLLMQQSEPPELQAVVVDLHQQTVSMQVAMRDLNQNLEQSQKEINILRQQLDHARVEALTDPLTGVLNRRGFELCLMEVLEAAHADGTPTSLVMIDIDHFKKVNDTHGHLFGDKVIRALAEVLKANVKGKDAVARLGGEEFGLLLPDTGVDGAKVLAEKIRQTMERGKIRRVDKNESIGGITISLGLALLIQGEDHAQLIDRADKALYASKTGGRNRVSISQQ
jgi:diguanylate cyclase